MFYLTEQCLKSYITAKSKAELLTADGWDFRCKNCLKWWFRPKRFIVSTGCSACKTLNLTNQKKDMDSGCMGRQTESQAKELVAITKTCLFNFDPIKPHFYVVKLGFTGVHIIFLISAQNIDCRYSLESPRRGDSNEYPQSMFWAEIWKISELFIWKFSFFSAKIFSIFE